MNTLRVFVGSPQDVHEERNMVSVVVSGLSRTIAPDDSTRSDALSHSLSHSLGHKTCGSPARAGDLGRRVDLS
jgi:hypothetical protein